MNICGTVADCRQTDAADAAVCVNNTVLGLASTAVWKISANVLQLTYQNASG
jgi:hypothetical protein